MCVFGGGGVAYNQPKIRWEGLAGVNAQEIGVKLVAWELGVGIVYGLEQLAASRKQLEKY